MPVIADSAVVLRCLEYSETSQVLVLLTRAHGKVRGIAKGIRRSTKKRFAAGIDLFDVGHVGLNVRQDRLDKLATVTEWRQVRAMLALREKLHRLYGAAYAVEVTGALTEEWDPHASLHDALVSTLLVLSEAVEPFGPCVQYQRRLLDAVGSLPRFDACIVCSRQQGLTHFSSLTGGMLCRSCERTKKEKRKVLPATRKALATGAPDAPAVGPFRLLDYHIAHLMGKETILARKLLALGRSSHGG